MVIQSLEVKNSPFFKDFRLEFSESLNCIMGGRGTGKTTILEFIKACVLKNIESNSYSYSILNNNLDSGLIELTILYDGIEYKIEKSLDDIPQIYSDGILKDTDEILNYINVDIYETNKIEKIGREPLDRLKLIDKKNQKSISKELNKIYNLQLSLDSNANKIRDTKYKIEVKKEELRDFLGIEDQLKNHKENKPDGLKEDEKKEFEEADKKQKVRNSENRLINELETNLSNIQKRLENLSTDIKNKIHFNPDFKPINQAVLDPVKEKITQLNELAGSKVSEINKLFSDTIDIIESQKVILKKSHSEQEANFIKLKQKFERHSNYLSTYNSLTNRLEKKSVLEKERKKLEETLRNLKVERRSISNSYSKLKEKIFNLRLNIVNELNKEFDNEIVIQLSFGGIKDEFEALLRKGLTGSGIHYNVLVPLLAKSFSPNEFAKIVNSKDLSELKTVHNIDDSRSKTIIESFKDSEELFEIEKLYLPDRPDFLLRVYKENEEVEPSTYKNSERLSMGQRCTTVLPIIFAVSENPLIIDQPEDNLDNEYISDTIRDIIAKQKKLRQLIFITHNPNIPVLSDAEYNVFFRFINKSEISDEGTVSDVKKSIIELLEGGREAFDRRREIYSEGE